MFNPSKYTKITIFILIVFLATNVILPAIYHRQLAKTAEAIIKELKEISKVFDKVKELAEKYPYMAAFLGIAGALFAACGVAGIKILGSGVETTAVCNVVLKIVDWLEKHAKDFYNSFLKKKLLEYLTDSIIRWIQGEDEKPLFVTNWRRFLGDVVDEAVGEYIETTKLAFLCRPFDFQIRVSLPRPGRPPLPTCTLDQIVFNIEDFYEDFRAGGWVAFNEMLYPWNNPYGAYLMALEGQAYEVAAALLEKEKETEQSQGFLSIKRCKTERIDEETGEKECLEKELTTPGGLIAEQVTKAIGSSLDFIVNSEDLTVYLTAIADAAINRLIRETRKGGGLLTMSTPNAPDELGTAPPSGYFTMKYSCVSGVCQLDENGKYESIDACRAVCEITMKYSCVSGVCRLDENGKYKSIDACIADCKPEPEEPEPTCDNCTGVFVRGRYDWYYGDTGFSCNGPVCGMCTGVGTVGKPPTPCQAFCVNVKDNDWPNPDQPQTFDKTFLTKYSVLFEHFGWSIPESCECSRAMLPDNFSYSNYCRECVALPAPDGHTEYFSACKKADWCDQNCP